MHPRSAGCEPRLRTTRGTALSAYRRCRTRSGRPHPRTKPTRWLPLAHADRQRRHVRHDQRGTREPGPPLAAWLTRSRLGGASRSGRPRSGATKPPVVPREPAIGTLLGHSGNVHRPLPAAALARCWRRDARRKVRPCTAGPDLADDSQRSVQEGRRMTRASDDLAEFLCRLTGRTPDVLAAPDRLRGRLSATGSGTCPVCRAERRRRRWAVGRVRPHRLGCRGRAPDRRPAVWRRDPRADEQPPGPGPPHRPDATGFPAHHPAMPASSASRSGYGIRSWAAFI